MLPTVKKINSFIYQLYQKQAVFYLSEPNKKSQNILRNISVSLSLLPGFSGLHFLKISPGSSIFATTIRWHQSEGSVLTLLKRIFPFHWEIPKFYKILHLLLKNQTKESFKLERKVSSGGVVNRYRIQSSNPWNL